MQKALGYDTINMYQSLLVQTFGAYLGQNIHFVLSVSSRKSGAGGPGSGRAPLRWRSGKCGWSRCCCGPAHRPASPHPCRPGKSTVANRWRRLWGNTLEGATPASRHSGLHFRPDLPPGQAFSASGEKDLTGGGLLLLGVFQQLPAQLVGKQDRPDLALEADLRLSTPGRLYREVFRPR